MSLSLKKINEWQLEGPVEAAITTLRNRCFPDHQKPRSYYKTRPQLRLLAFQGKRLVAHLGVEHRVIAVAEQPLKIFGVVDLCVAPENRGQGLASRLLEELRDLAERSQVEALLLAADDHRLYLRHGFQSLTVSCSWLRVEDHKNYGVAEELLQGVLMVCPLGQAWPEGAVDMLGTLF